MSSKVAFDVLFSQMATYTINDLLLGIEEGDLCNFADDNRLYTCCESLNDAKFLIESQCSLITYRLVHGQFYENEPRKVPSHYSWSEDHS